MSGNLLSASWYRVARLKPRIRSHARFHRHRYRGQLWYLLQDPATGRCHRLSPAAYLLAGLMNGERTTQEIWDAASARLGDDGPTQDETIRVLGLLHIADVLQCDVPPDTAEILRRYQRREQGEWWRRFANPFAIRIPLWDPDAFLERWLPFARPLFTPAAAVAWGLVVVIAVVLAVVHGSDLSHGAARTLLDPRNLLVLGVVYPLVKAIHELGHAFATKVWGGEVHEMGILLLVFMPIPYVDASASSVFPDKRQRMAVGAAGVGVELLLAALALFVWLAVEPGVVRMIAYNVMWIGAASSLLFNGNPLLRFDGYYVLSDAIEIPNLGQRSTQYLSYLVFRHAFGLENSRYPVSAPGEAPWFFGYGVAAFVYRLFIMVAIALFVAERFFVVGVLLALFAVAMQVVVPLGRALVFLLTNPRLGEKRPRALVASFGTALAVSGFLLLAPVPLSTRAQGVVWPPEGAEVRAGADGFVVRVLAAPGSMVGSGDPLVLTRDPTLEAALAVREAELRELRARHHAERRTDRVRAQITLEEIRTAEASLALARERVGDVVVRSPGDGSFVVPRATNLVGRFVRQGERIGYVVGNELRTARVLVPQGDARLVRARTRGVEVRLSRRLGEVLPAQVRREVPAATDRLPSRALGSEGGGPFAVDPEDPEGLRTLETVFALDVELPEAALAREIGARVYVRFDHGSEPLAWRAYRGARRLFLRRVGV